MSAQRCTCNHYRFAHVHAKGRCDDCGCDTFRPLCSMCYGSGWVRMAAVTAGRADWADAATTMPCPRCSG